MLIQRLDVHKSRQAIQTTTPNPIETRFIADLAIRDTSVGGALVLPTEARLNNRAAKGVGPEE